jgi:biotin--protein ligase
MTEVFEQVQLVYSGPQEKISLGAAFDKLLRPQVEGEVPRAVLTEAGQESTSFKTVDYFKALKTKRLGRSLFVTPSITSTQTFVNEHFKNQHGVALLADQQTAGKGRGTNVWTSPPGCLMVTFSVMHNSAAWLPHFQYLVSLAIVRSVKQLTGGEDLGLKLKWPNDIYAKNQKIGGVLCQSSYDGKTFLVLSGIGLNVTNSEPTTCLSDLQKTLPFPKTEISRENMLATFFNNFELMHGQLELQGFSVFSHEYIYNWLHTGQEVMLKEEGSERKVVIRGLTPGGFLLAEDAATKEELELHPDSNSLNFWEGFISRKLQPSSSL